jgi:hypothetical protein
MVGTSSFDGIPHEALYDNTHTVVANWFARAREGERQSCRYDVARPFDAVCGADMTIEDGCCKAQSPFGSSSCDNLKHRRPRLCPEVDLIPYIARNTASRNYWKISRRGGRAERSSRGHPHHSGLSRLAARSHL